jgi:GT2 family glycosyltransferase
VFDRDPRCGIAGGLYYSRDGLRPMAVAKWNPRDTTSAYTPAFADAPVQVDGVGFGCVLVSCSVLRKLDEPYFPAQIFIEEQIRRVRVCNEDYVFCHRLKEYGYNTYLHAGVRLGHYDRASATTIPLSWESTEATNQNRMTVRRADGSQALVPLDSTVAATREEHVPAALEYIFQP